MYGLILAVHHQPRPSLFAFYSASAIVMKPLSAFFSLFLATIRDHLKIHAMPKKKLFTPSFDQLPSKKDKRNSASARISKG
jgi:hypothetical protein